MVGGVEKYIGAEDFVVIKGNAQWENQGYTHTGCIKGVIDNILNIDGYNGEILICDNVQGMEPYGFQSTPSQRLHNWSEHNWDSLAAEYQAAGKPVATKRWINTETDLAGPILEDGWVRDFFDFKGMPTYLAYPVFESPLTPGTMIDMKNGIWREGSYDGRQVKALFMPTLNNHGNGWDDYSGVTSAIKSFFGATAINCSPNCLWNHNGNTYRHIHSISFSLNRADYAGELVGRFINTMYSPSLYITAAMWSGHYSRTGAATETKTVLACENPVTLDYIACKDVISPHAYWLNPDEDYNTRKQILGCLNAGIGTINPYEYEIIQYDFDNPTVSRADIEKKIKEVKDGITSEEEVKLLIQEYMETD